MDFVELQQVPGRLREPLLRALRGEPGGWPPALTRGDVGILVVHGIAPLVYSVTHHSDLREEAIRASAIEPLRAAGLAAVLECLAGAGVPALVVKGSALAYEVYPSPELRARGDTDLLIAPESIPAMRSALLGAGLTEQHSSGDEHGMRQSMFLHTDEHGLRHVYDVHWDVANSPVFSPVIRFEDAMERSIPVPALGPHARTLSRVDALLLACIHRVAHHHDSERLIWLADIALLRDRMTTAEHEEFWRTAAKHRVVAVCSRSIQLAGEWMSRPPVHGPGDWLTAEEVGRDEPSRAFLDRDMRYGDVMLADFRAMPLRARLARLLHLAFPRQEYMRQAFGMRSRLQLPWLYAVRGLRGVRRLFHRAGSTRL